MTLCTCGATGTSVAITWFWWLWKWNHFIPKVKTTETGGAIWFYGYMMPLALTLVWHHANSIINGTSAFLRSRQSNWDTTWPYWSCNTMGAGSWWFWQHHHQWHHCILWAKKLKWGETWLFCYVKPLAQASYDANGVINGTTVFIRSRKLKLGTTWLFCHVMPLVPESYDANGIINDTITFLRSKQFKWGAKCLFCIIFCIMWPMALTSHDTNETITFFMSRQIKSDTK